MSKLNVLNVVLHWPVMTAGKTENLAVAEIADRTA